MYHADDDTKSLGKTRATGSVVKHRGVWTARVTFTTSDGKRRETRVRAASKVKAGDARDQILADLREFGPDEYLRRKALREHPLAEDPPPPVEVEGTPLLATEAATILKATEAGSAVFHDRTKRYYWRDMEGALQHTPQPIFGMLADHYRLRYAFPPETHTVTKGRSTQETTRAGMRSWSRAREHVAVLETEFGRDFPLEYLTLEVLQDFKRKRLETPVQLKGWKQPRKRSDATVHRTLAILRRMLKIARRRKWIADDPFDDPECRLIDMKQENYRMRVLSLRQEVDLLKRFNAKERALSRAAIVTLIETGARVGEIVRMPEEPETRRRLQWNDVDMVNSKLRLVSSKTESGERFVGITPRLAKELQALRAMMHPEPDGQVFAALTYYRLRSDFREARKEAGLEEFTLHDLRHTRATRWVQGGIGVSEVGHLLGHSKKSHTTVRYINPDDATVTRALLADAEFRKQSRRRKTEADDEAVN